MRIKTDVTLEFSGNHVSLTHLRQDLLKLLLESRILGLSKLDHLLFFLDTLLALSFSFGCSDLLLLKFELHFNAKHGFALLSLTLGLLIVVLGLNFGLQLGHLLFKLAFHFLGLGLLCGLLRLHLDAKLIHLPSILGLNSCLLFGLSGLMLSILEFLFLLHGVLVGDGALRVVLELHLAVSILAPVEQDSACAEDDSVVGLEIDWVSRSELVSIDVAMCGRLSTGRHQGCAITLRLESGMLRLDTDAA